MNYPESQMSEKVSAWIATQGYTVYVEVPIGGRKIDLLGVKWADQSLIAVELKVQLSEGVCYQACLNALVTCQTFAAVSCSPRSLAKAEKYKIGVLLIGESVSILKLPDAFARETYQPRIEQVLRYCRVAKPGGTAGLPTLLGVGPAQQVYDAVAKYRAENPGAKWKEIYTAIPNQYCSPQSMQCALRHVRDIRADRERKSIELSRAAVFGEGV